MTAETTEGATSEQWQSQLTDRFGEALRYAEKAHRNQARKGTDIPYVAHLLGVASLALEGGADEDQAIAALLHDAVEDQGGPARLADIQSKFGNRVANIVSDCTDSWEDPKPDWKPRKEDYLAQMEHKSPDSLLVSLADKTHNARSIITDVIAHGNSVWDRFTASREDTLWYYRSLAERFERHLPGPGADRFRALVTEMHAIAAGPGTRD